MKFKSEQRASELNGFLDRGSRLEGKLDFDASFRVDGQLVGKVTSDGSLVVGEGGEVEGEIRVGEVFVSGTVRGEVYAYRKIHLAPNARAIAHLHTPSLVIEDGAVFEGRCTMAREEGAAEPSVERGPQLLKPVSHERRGG